MTLEEVKANIGKQVALYCPKLGYPKHIRDEPGVLLQLTKSGMVRIQFGDDIKKFGPSEIYLVQTTSD